MYLSIMVNDINYVYINILPHLNYLFSITIIIKDRFY